MARRTVLAALLGAALALPAASPPAAAQDGAPANPAGAVAQARPLIDAARATKPIDPNESKRFKENGDVLRKALDLMKGQTKDGFEQVAFVRAWNELASLFHYHGVKGGPEHRMRSVTMQVLPIRFAYPAERGWTFQEKYPGKDDQQWGELVKRIGAERPVRIVKIWMYRWDTVYSDVGGENAKKIAEGNMEYDRAKFKKVTFRSDRIVTARLSRGFPKTSYYEIVGDDESYGPARRRNYYVKGKSATYNFEVIEIRRTEEADDPWTAWQAAGESCELDAVLASIEEFEKKK
jgi:hypothetical protein